MFFFWLFRTEFRWILRTGRLRLLFPPGKRRRIQQLLHDHRDVLPCGARLQERPRLRGQPTQSPSLLVHLFQGPTQLFRSRGSALPVWRDPVDIRTESGQLQRQPGQRGLRRLHDRREFYPRLRGVCLQYGRCGPLFQREVQGATDSGAKLAARVAGGCPGAAAGSLCERQHHVAGTSFDVRQGAPDHEWSRPADVRTAGVDFHGFRDAVHDDRRGSAGQDRGRPGKIPVLFDRSIDWLICSVFDWLIDLFSVRSIDWLIDLFSVRLIDWFVQCSIDWLIDWFVQCSIDWLIDWFVQRSIDWLTDWLSDGLIASFVSSYVFSCIFSAFYSTTTCCTWERQTDTLSSPSTWTSTINRPMSRWWLRRLTSSRGSANQWLVSKSWEIKSLRCSTTRSTRCRWNGALCGRVAWNASRCAIPIALGWTTSANFRIPPAGKTFFHKTFFCCNFSSDFPLRIFFNLKFFSEFFQKFSFDFFFIKFFSFFLQYFLGFSLLNLFFFHFFQFFFNIFGIFIVEFFFLQYFWDFHCWIFFFIFFSKNWIEIFFFSNVVWPKNGHGPIQNVRSGKDDRCPAGMSIISFLLSLLLRRDIIRGFDNVRNAFLKRTLFACKNRQFRVTDAIFERGYADRVDICNFTFMTFAHTG